MTALQSQTAGLKQERRKRYCDSRYQSQAKRASSSSNLRYIADKIATNQELINSIETSPTRAASRLKLVSPTVMSHYFSAGGTRTVDLLHQPTSIHLAETTHPLSSFSRSPSVFHFSTSITCLPCQFVIMLAPSFLKRI